MNTQTNSIVFILFIGFALYNVGYMFNSQLQHFALYPYLNPDGFTNYMQHNNKFAVAPAVVPGFVTMLLAVLLIWIRPNYVPANFVYFSVALNLIVIISTFIWQKALHVELAETGFDAAKIKLLLNTNWIRTVAYAIQGISILVLLKNILQQINLTK
jgi:hypothetical protein